MKSFSLAVWLAVGQVMAAPAVLQAIDGVISDGPFNIKRQNGNQGDGDGFGSCNADPVFRELRKAENAQGASSFCSSYIRPTATTSVTVTIPTTAVVTEFATVPITTTTTSVVTGDTSTVTCAAQPTAPPTCGLEANGLGRNLISTNSGLSPVECHLACLANEDCESFQVGDATDLACNLFRTATAGNVFPSPGSGFRFYDRNCPDLLPAQCTPNALKQKRQVAPTPSFLATIAPSRISSVCSCLVTAFLTPSTITLTQQTTIPNTITATAVTTQVVTEVIDTTTTPIVITTAPV